MARATSPLLAWHGDAKLQRETVKIMAGHRKADTLVKGLYWEDGKGCAVGCLIHGSDHSLYEPRFGIPQALARLEDMIFENLPNGDAMKWPERFLKAARPGADLSLVQWQFLEFVVDEALSRKEAASVREACQPALEVVRAKARGEEVSASAAESAARSAAWSAESAARSAAWSAESAAESAARSAAWSAESAAESAARSAAWSAAESAASAAWSAARSAAWSAARSAAWSAESAAWSAAWKRYADKLIDLMAAAPVPAMQEAA